MNLMANSVQEPFSVALGLILMKGAPLLFCVGWTASFLWRRIQTKELRLVALAFGLAILWAMRLEAF